MGKSCNFHLPFAIIFDPCALSYVPDPAWVPTASGPTVPFPFLLPGPARQIKLARQYGLARRNPGMTALVTGFFKAGISKMWGSPGQTSLALDLPNNTMRDRPSEKSYIVNPLKAASGVYRQKNPKYEANRPAPLGVSTTVTASDALSEISAALTFSSF
jgi:hypothetical protein